MHERSIMVEPLRANRSNGAEPTKLERVVTELPAGFDVLRAEARSEKYANLDRLAEQWNANTVRFNRESETLLAARIDDALAGIGGLTIDPVQSGALRMRRFYVGKSFRRTGVGRAIAENLLARAHASGRLVTVNAASGSEPFWEAMGFVPELRDGHTHVLSYAANSSPRKAG